MKRTPIIIPGQVYLHNELNEYAVVTKATKGDIRFSGIGFSGMNESENFLERFSPVDPADLEAEEATSLLGLLHGVPLSVGWVTSEDDDGDEEGE